VIQKQIVQITFSHKGFLKRDSFQLGYICVNEGNNLYSYTVPFS